MKTYSEKLKDPRWQKKRLEVMQRDEFSCQCCGDSEATLNVHHWYYEKSKEPWEYPMNAFSCLCEDCHKVCEHTGLEIKKMINHPVVQSSVYNALKNTTFFDLDNLAGAFIGYRDNSVDQIPIPQLRACIRNANSLIHELGEQIERLYDSMERSENENKNSQA